MHETRQTFSIQISLAHIYFLVSHFFHALKRERCLPCQIVEVKYRRKTNGECQQYYILKSWQPDYSRVLRIPYLKRLFATVERLIPRM